MKINTRVKGPRQRKYFSPSFFPTRPPVTFSRQFSFLFLTSCQVWNTLGVVFINPVLVFLGWFRVTSPDETDRRKCCFVCVTAVGRLTLSLCLTFCCLSFFVALQNYILLKSALIFGHVYQICFLWSVYIARVHAVGNGTDRSCACHTIKSFSICQ